MKITCGTLTTYHLKGLLKFLNNILDQTSHIKWDGVIIKGDQKS